MKSYLLWDLDGVLVETEPLYFEATRDCIAELGIELDRNEYLQDMVIVTTARREDFELIHAEPDLVRHLDFVLASGQDFSAATHLIDSLADLPSLLGALERA